MRADIESLMRQADDDTINNADLSREDVRQVFDDVIAKRIDRAEAIDRLRIIENMHEQDQLELQRDVFKYSSKRLSPFERLRSDWVAGQLVRAGLIHERAVPSDIREASQITMLKFGQRCLEEKDARHRDLGAEQIADVMYREFRDWAEGTARQPASDFPLAAEDVLRKALLLGYDEAQAGEPLTFLYRLQATPDFKTIRLLQKSEVPDLQPVAENAGFPQADMGDYGEEKAIGTKGIVLSLTRQAIINNDLSTAALTASGAGAAARRAEADDIHAMLTSSYLMKDGTELFHASRNNLAGAAAAPSVSTVDAIRLAMAGFTGPSDATLNMYPSVLICGRGYEGTSATLRNAQYLPMQEAITPGYTPGSFVVVSDGRFGNEWFMLADPRYHSGIVKLHLEGSAGQPQIEFMTQFEYDGVQGRVRHDYAIAAADWRVFYKTPAT